MNRKVFLLVMAGLLSNRGVFAGEATSSFTGQEMVVTATKTVNSVSDAGGSSVTVISAEDIKNSVQQTVEEVIKGTAGIDVVANGGLGSTTSVFIRGADSGATLVLVDGVAINDPSSTNRKADLANIMVDNIERIEVVRGPVSVLYGSNAMAGVINIITASGMGIPKSHVGMEGGSYGTWKAYAGVNGKKDALTYSLDVSRLKSDGFSIADDRNPRIPHAGNTSEKDGYSNSSLSANIGYALSRKVHLDTILRYIDSTVKLDDYLWAGYAGDRSDADPSGKKDNHTESRRFIGRIALKIDTEPLRSTIFYNFSDERRDVYDNDNIKTDIYKGNIYETGWQGDLAVAENNTLTAGISYQKEHADTESYLYLSSLDKTAGMSSVFLQDQWRIGGLKLVSAVRNDDHETFGGHFTWRFAPSIKVGSTTIKASYGTGFRSPSIYELYSEYGNVNLGPETSIGWDAGLEHRFSGVFRAGATWFRSDFENRIDYDWLTSKYAQVSGTTRTWGIESFVEWIPLKSVFMTAHYTWTHTEDPDGNPLVRRPEHKASFSQIWKVNEKLRLNSSMLWAGERNEIPYAMDKSGNPAGKLNSYFLCNLSASYKIGHNVELYGRIDNLFDEYYEEAWSYATPGRSAYAGIKVTY
jgi:vitamin B12 transporter